MWVLEHMTMPRRAFIMQVALMWTVNDLLAYGIASEWSTIGVMGCSICMDNTMTFHLSHGRKACTLSATDSFYRANISPAVEMLLSLPDDYGSDHKWTKKSICWDLPYWPTLLIRHNLDVMHIEKNVFDNIFNTVMDIKEKMKDHMNAHRDLKITCNRPELELNQHRPNVIPKAVYTLLKEQKMRVCERIRGLKFSDGYASNLPCYIDMKELQIHGMKSQDYHVFMQKLIPIASHEMFPGHVWSSLTDVSILFQSICSTTLDVHKLHELENSVAIILCNLRKIFSPTFFESIEHLIVHLLASDATKKRRLSGPERHIIEMYILVHPKLNYTDKSYLSVIIGVPVQKWHLSLPTLLTVACQSEEVVPVPIVVVDNQSYDICYPNVLQVVLEAAGTSRRGLHENENENEDEDEDSGGDNETDDEEFEGTSQAKLYGQGSFKCHYWGPSAKVTSVTVYVVNGYNFQTERHDTVKSIMNCDGVADDSKWTETVAYQPKKVVPVPIVVVDNQSYDVREPNDLHVILEATGTSRTQLHENDDENEDEDEDSDGDNETDDEKSEAT
ncbi:UNVERIFIED_CONTAM: hypothetical protein Sradi_1346900 [Sesamum radiatum]|uniref:DUF4218 domain-containing protein n=1 Tax=Sesamum radiatum TaxID=300843 RepID=A0AAW2UPT6_SESRA